MTPAASPLSVRIEANLAAIKAYIAALAKHLGAR
jgi:hypothetical protein